MKLSITRGDVMRLAEVYANETSAYAKGRERVGALSDAHAALKEAVTRLEFLAFIKPPCNLCVHANAPPAGPPCCDCVRTPAGQWRMFVESPKDSL